MLKNIGLLLATLTTTAFFTSNHVYANVVKEDNSLLNIEIIRKIKDDVSYNNDTLSTFKEEFQSYYQSDVLPRIEELEKHLLQRPIEISANTYLLTTAGVAPSSWGGREYLYVISSINDSPEIILSHEFDPKPVWSPNGYEYTDLWVSPNQNCGYNDFVHALFQYGSLGGSSSSFFQVYIKFNHYDNQYQISVDRSPVRFSLTSCLEN